MKKNNKLILSAAILPLYQSYRFINLTALSILPLFIASTLFCSVYKEAGQEFAKALSEQPLNVKVQPDLSGLGSEVGTAVGDVITKSFQKGAGGFAKVTEGGQFGKDIESGLAGISGDLTTAIANALGDPRLRQELERGGTEWAGMVGAGARGTRIGLQRDVYPEMQQITQGAIGSVFNTHNALQFGLPLLLGGTLALTGIYGPRVFWRVVEQRLLNPKPAILLAGSKYGRTDRWKRWWAGYKTPPMIFDQSVKERLEEIEEKTRNIRDHIRNGQKITYDNLLLYGKPGTGKTLFAQILADKTDMDFLPVTAASLLQSGVEGIKYFDELVTMANNSKYGVIIFVDEADALFVNRDSLKPDSDHYKVLNHILAATGSGSNKFMLIAATNHAYVMDPAMGRRFQDRVEMPLPDVATRKELLTIYMDEQLFNAKNRNSQFVSAARAILTDARMNQIAQQTAGLSHAEIKDMVTIMGKKANATKNGIITQRNVDSAVAEAIEKMKALERDKMELEKKTLHMRSQVQPQMRANVMEEEVAAAAA